MATNGPFATFDEAYAYIAQFTNYERMAHVDYTRQAMDLDRVRRVLTALDSPDTAYPIVHVAGTKGKGSVCAMIASILRRAGFRVGLFSKPHLVRLNERISVNGQDITDEQFVALMNRLYQHLEAQRVAGNPLTFFDLITILALAHFANEAVDFVVLEVGLGGRLDSTNVVTPSASVITTIGYDHTEQLGDTLGKIAREKAGIIKPGVPVVSAVSDPEPGEVILDVARRQQAPLYAYERDFQLELPASSDRFSVRTWRELYTELTLPLLGEHQRRNATVAIGAIEALREAASLSLATEAVSQGLESVRIRGRIERLSDDPLVVLDVAHNPDSLRTLRETLQSTYPERSWVALFGTPIDKDVDGNLREILQLASHVVFTTTDNPRGTPPGDLRQKAESISPDVASDAIPDLEAALRRALKLAGRRRGTCIAGWFHMAGEVAKLWSGQDPLARS